MSLQDYSARWLEPQHKTINAKACCIALNPTRSLVAVGYTRYASSGNFFEPQITQSTFSGNVVLFSISAESATQVKEFTSDPGK